MREPEKTHSQLIDEIATLRQRVATLEAQLQQVEQRGETDALQSHPLPEYALQIALDAANMVAWDLDLATDFVSHSSDYTREVEIAGTKITRGIQIVELTHPEDRDQVRDAVRQCVTTGRPYSVEFRVVGVDNRVRWMSGHGTILKNARQEPSRMTGVVIDITERKEQELELVKKQQWIERIYAITPGVIYLHNLSEQRFVVLSPHKHHILGYTSAEFHVLAGVSGYRHMHPDDVGRIAAYLQQLERVPDGLVTGIEYRVKHKDGTWQWALSRETVFSRTTDGKVHQILGVAVNIDDRKRAEETMQTLSHRLMKMQEHERQYLAHELHEEVGQSLTALLMHLQVSETELAQLTGRPSLRDSISLVQRMVSQVRDLSLDLRPPILDSLGLSEALRWYLRRQSQRTGVAMDLYADGAEARPDRVIEETCYRVVQEAVANAARHASAQNLQVELHSTADTLFLSVRDDGNGFNLDSIQRAQNGESRVGLFSMEERLRLIGGSLVVTSTPGEGTEVQITVPLRERMK